MRFRKSLTLYKIKALSFREHTYYLGGDIGQGVAPMIAGVVVGNASAPLKGYVTSFQMTGILLICAMTGLIFIYCREKRKL